jgi:hypothetical protein
VALPHARWGASALGDADGDGLGDIGLAMPYLTDSSAAGSWGLVVPGAAARGEVDAIDVGWTLSGEKGYTAGYPAFAAGDVDGDGLDDVAAVAWQGSHPPTGYAEGARVRVVPGSALSGPAGSEIDATYAEIPAPFDLGVQGTAVAALGDVDGDGRGDLAVSDFPDPGVATAWVVSGANPPASLADAVALVGSGPAPSAGPGPETDGGGWATVIALGDLDGDGLADLAASFGPYGSSSGNDGAELAVIPGAAIPSAGSLSLAAFDLSHLEVHDLVACDLDGDGLAELVTEVGIWSGADLLIPEAAPLANGVGTGRGIACLGDIDGDGAEDLAYGILGYSGGAT